MRTVSEEITKRGSEYIEKRWEKVRMKNMSFNSSIIIKKSLDGLFDAYLMLIVFHWVL